MNQEQLIGWLLQGDVSIQYQVHRDLLSTDRSDLQNRIGKEGWGAQFLSARNVDGHWGQQFYQPKWISTHYTLLDLRNVCLSPHNTAVKETIDMILSTSLAEDGGLKLGPSTAHRSDVCVNGMFLNYASYFNTEEQHLHSVVDSILKEIMPDGGFNCRSTRSGATHSSLHTTLSILEGIHEFQKAGYTYRFDDLQSARESAVEFILIHRLYLSDRTGDIINKEFLKLTYPARWKYNILRALDYFQEAKIPWDGRMDAAMQVLLDKRNKDRTWNVQAKHPGKVHFQMEKAGKPSRWNTLRSLRVIEHFDFTKYSNTIIQK